MEDLNEIAIYARVVEKKSFSAAAKEMHLSPSVVSKRVTALEERLEGWVDIARPREKFGL